jgi:hypothetical protein
MPRDLLLVEVDGPTMKVKDSPSRVNPGFAACVVEVVLPVLRESFGLKRNKKTMLVIPCTKQKELYLFLSLSSSAAMAGPRRSCLLCSQLASLMLSFLTYSSTPQKDF